MRSVLALLAIMSLLSGFSVARGDALDEAQRLAAEGKYEEALQKQIWIHNHILEKDRAYYGVRLSFALASWVELGKKYPKALTALSEIRDQKSERLLKSELDRELFHDVAAINRYLKEPGSTVNLFKKLEKASPQFAAQVYGLGEESIVEAGDYTLARRYVGAPMVRLKAADARLKSSLKRVNSSSMPDVRRQAYETIFSDEVVRLITILKNTSDAALAAELQKAALKTLDAPAIRNALQQ